MKNLLAILMVALVILLSGCESNNNKKNTEKEVIDKSFMTEVEQKADKTKQEATELNKELDSMIRELNTEK